MAFAKLHLRSKTFTPADYTANETKQLITVHAGELIMSGVARQFAAYNGSGTDAIIAFGDAGSTGRFVTAGDLDETSATDATEFLGTGGDNPFLYESDDTLDVTFTANTAGTRTTGKTEFRVLVWRAWP